MYYKDRRVLLASKHEKEKAIAEVFFNKLECQLCVEAFDTDQFGTFTGEIARPLTPYETCVLKAKTAAEQFDYNLSLASEGSFGPHPAFSFIPSAHEIMVFIDKANNWVIAEQLISQKTNYTMLTIDAHTELDDFLRRVDFPNHALTLQMNTGKELIAKGIRDKITLLASLENGFQHEQQLFLATDMRAMMNPTRMEVLSELAYKLAVRIGSQCPGCNIPGFGFKTTKGKLPCSLCHSPTSYYELEIWGCIACDYQESKPRKDGLKQTEPACCDYCNP